MDARSEAFLARVEPDLAKVMRAAAQAPQPWRIVQGLRTLAAEQEAVATGHSHTLHSRHLPDKNGLAAAVDVAALVGGAVSWAPGREAEVFGQIAAQVEAAAKALGVPVMWGGAAIGAWIPGVVSHFRDWGHFQLPWDRYP